MPMGCGSVDRQSVEGVFRYLMPSLLDVRPMHLEPWADVESKRCLREALASSAAEMLHWAVNLIQQGSKLLPRLCAD